MNLKANTSLYTLILDGLLNENCLLDFPAKKHERTGAIEKFQQWTQNPKSEIYSGYRDNALNSSDHFDAKSLADQLRKDFNCLVVFGIGGSALGAMAVVRALEPLVPTVQRKRVEFCDNLDPLYFEDLWSTLDIQKTAFAFISKSGSTIETISQLSVVCERLKNAKANIQSQIVVVTDPTKGPLRQWAENNSIKTLSVPTQVGGRFSVFTAVGLLPIAFCGIDIESFLNGAKSHFNSNGLEFEKMFSLAERIQDCEEGGVRAHSFWPYSTTMRFVSSWFVQLWGESLGKVSRKNVSVGTIPIPGIGATDQHSFLQLLAEGRKNIVAGFLKVKNWPQIGIHSNIIPRMDSEFKDISYLTGQTMGYILNAEADATEASLLKNQRPTYRIEIETLDAPCIGALLAFFMDLTTYSGVIMDLNPFDQPGVEGGKVILKKLLSV